MKTKLNFSSVSFYSVTKLTGVSIWTLILTIALGINSYSFAQVPVADFIGTPTIICEGNSVVFTDNSTNSPTSWSWTFAGGTPGTSTLQNPAIVYNTAGIYDVTLIATNARGSDDTTITGYINVNSLPTANLGPDQSACEGETVTLDAGPGVGYSYLWSTTETTQTIDVTITGNYSVTITDGLGCTGTDSVNVIFNSNPTANLGPDQSACDGDIVTLDAGAGYMYLWSDASTNQTIDVTVAGTYSVTITDGNGCNGTDTIIIQ